MPRKKFIPHEFVARRLLSITQYMLDRGEWDRPEGGPTVTDSVEHIRWQKDQTTRKMDRFHLVLGYGKDAKCVLVTCEPVPFPAGYTPPPDPDDEDEDEDAPEGVVIPLSASVKQVLSAIALGAPPADMEDAEPSDDEKRAFIRGVLRTEP